MGKRRREHPWRVKSSEVIDRFEVIRRRDGTLDVWTFRETTYARKNTAFISGQEIRVETSRGPLLSRMTKELRITDKQDTLLTLLEAGLDTIRRLTFRHKRLENKQEQIRLETYRRERAAKKAQREAQQHHKQNLTRRAEGRFVRRLDV